MGVARGNFHSLFYLKDHLSVVITTLASVILLNAQNSNTTLSIAKIQEICDHQERQCDDNRLKWFTKKDILTTTKFQSFSKTNLFSSSQPLKTPQIMQHHWLVFLGISMESSNVDSVLVSTIGRRLLVAEPQSCRSAGEICLSSLRHRRTGVISVLSSE